MKPVVIYTCDAWKSWASASLVGVYTNRKKLEKRLRKMLKADDIEIDGWESDKIALSKMTINEMHIRINYLIIQEIELNSEI